MTSNSTFPKRLTKIDDLTRPDHYHLTVDDTCYYIGEYTAREGYAFSATNQLIYNLKKSVLVRGQVQWEYKEQAIKQAASALRDALNNDALNAVTFVPIPPSKSKSDPLYDDRLYRVLHTIRPNPTLDIRELILQKNSMEAVHLNEKRLSPDDLKECYEIDENLIEPLPNNIILFDDVITTGSHFKAAKNILCEIFPNANILGLFLARRVPETIDIEDIFSGFFNKDQD
ncbi:hypothetical protein [Thiolapillus sp.]|uniref:hypothetical protein n=2 Tax=Thiolapillus sp. TaxID=2017437 RepID=UPI003AF9DF18